MSSKISQLTAVSSVGGGEAVPCALGGSNYRLTPSQLAAAYGLGSVVTPPDNTQFTWTNQGGAAVDATGPGILMSIPVTASTNVLRIRKKTPVGGTFILTALLQLTAAPGNYSGAGIAVIDSTGALLFLELGWNNGGGLAVALYSDPTTVVGNQYNAAFNPWPLLQGTWLRIASDGTTLTFSYSVNGRDFAALVSQDITTHLADVTSLAWVGNNPWAGSGTPAALARLLSWGET